MPIDLSENQRQLIRLVFSIRDQTAAPEFRVTTGNVLPPECAQVVIDYLAEARDRIAEVESQLKVAAKHHD